MQPTSSFTISIEKYQTFLDFWIYILFDSVLEYHTVNKIYVKVNLTIVVHFIKIVAHLQPFCDY